MELERVAIALRPRSGWESVDLGFGMARSWWKLCFGAFWITYLPKSLGGGTFYLTALRDKDGDLFDRNVSYRLRVPADTPAKDFWSVIVYSMKTKGFVEGVDRVGLSSKDLDRMRINENDSVNLYFGSKAPAGLESNWVPTGGEDFFLMFRLYGPDKPLFDKSWVLGDVEKVR